MGLTSIRDNFIITGDDKRTLWGTAMGDLSAHFSKAELACHCCGQLKIEQGLIDALEQLRSLAGQEVRIHDGYRCHAHNQEVGGVTDSEHTRGQAADVGIPGLSLQQMYELALQIPTFAEGGIGVYDGGFLHLDIRPYAARWARVRGQYVGIQHLVKQPLTLLAKVQPSSQAG
jgi:Peptidase M15